MNRIQRITRADWGEPLQSAALRLAPVIAAVYVAGWALGTAIHQASAWTAKAWSWRPSGLGGATPAQAVAIKEPAATAPAAAPAPAPALVQQQDLPAPRLAPGPVRRRASKAPPAPISVPDVLASEEAK